MKTALREGLRLLLVSFSLVVFSAVVFSALIAQTPPESNAPPFQRIGNMSQLMISILYPTSNSIFYVETRAPQTQTDWNNLESQALILAESANLLMMPGRARDQDVWMKDAKLLADAGMKAVQGARAKDMPALIALNAELYTACVSCHQHYRPNYRRRAPPKNEAPAQQ